MRFLILYHAGQTYTSTVFEHIDSFRRYSSHEWHYLHYSLLNQEQNALNSYQGVFVHYSVRLPFDQINGASAELLSQYQGIKGLFIQDEYDNVNRTKYWIKKIDFDIVFTVVPEKNINKIYPSYEFPRTRFINNLTGYVPSDLSALYDGTVSPPSQRNIVIGYRGRALPIRYGALGQEKIKIGMDVKNFCKKKKIIHDIEWNEYSRIYGNGWYRFISSCKAMLGSESGSNIFDWNGDLKNKIKDLKKSHPFMSDKKLYLSFIKPLEHDGLMNQISPRIFEMAACRTIMILYEGSYSNVIKPNIHFLPLKRDLSNLPEIIDLLKDDSFIDAMALKVKSDIIDSGYFSYSSFIKLVDQALSGLNKLESKVILDGNSQPNSFITLNPSCAPSPLMHDKNLPVYRLIKIIINLIKDYIPIPIKSFIKKLIGRA